MKPNGLLLLLGVVVLLPLGCFYYISNNAPAEPTTADAMIVTWSDGPEVELNLKSLAMLNRDLGRLVQKEAPKTGVAVVALAQGSRSVQIMSCGTDKVPPPLQKDLQALARQRGPELAKGQGK